MKLGLHHFGYSHILFRGSHRHFEFHLNPIHLFLHADPFHVDGIVRIIVDGSHSAQLVEAFYQHSFGIQVGKSEGALNDIQSAFASPSFDRFNQLPTHFFIINEVNPTKAYGLLAPLGIGPMIHDRCNTTYYTPITNGQKIVGLTKLKGRILLRRKGLEHVFIKIGN